MTLDHRFSSAFLISLCLLFGPCNPSAAQSSSQAELISNFRSLHGLSRVTMDSTLNRIAQQQAAAMAARDVLEHDAAGSFSSRIASTGAGHAAENIAYGYDSFPKTLNQWINSSGHRRNLLMQNASRVGVASAKSSRTGRTYWAMVIAGNYDQTQRTAPKSTPKAKLHARGRQDCHMTFVGLCF